MSETIPRRLHVSRAHRANLDDAPWRLTAGRAGAGSRPAGTRAVRGLAPGIEALLDAMLAVEEDGTRFSEDEVAANATFLFLAGHETTWTRNLAYHSAMESVRVDILPAISAFKGALEEGTQTYSYVVVFGDFSVLVDVRDELLIEALRAFPSPRHLILTHRHIRKHEAAIERAFGLEVWQHPQDARAPRRGPAENTPYATAYHDPFTGELADLGFQFFNIPGHTPGCTFALLDVHGGTLFTGDAVIGTKPAEPVGLDLPPDWTCDDPVRAKESILAIDIPPHQNILPSHGEPVVGVGVNRTAELWATLRARLAAR